MIINIDLPKLHINQQHIKKNLKRFNTICCGRRFGKNILLEDIIVEDVLKGHRVAHMEPTYKMVSEVWRDLLRLLRPIITRANSSEMRMEFITGGTLEFWSLENYDSIRGRKYHLITINEAAMFRYLKEAWNEVIRPTLTDYKGRAIFLSTPKGDNFFKELFDRGYNAKMEDWANFRYTSYDNPKLDGSEIDVAREELPEIEFRQEYLAEFVTADGTLLREKFIKYFDLDTINLKELDIVMAVDLAISQKTTADYSAIVVMGRNKETGNIYVMDVYRDKIKFNDIIKSIKFYAEKWNPKVIGIEAVQAQAYVVQELIRTTQLNIKALHPDKDKVTRFQAIQARFENGLVYIENNIIKEYTKELLAFPIGEHDDMVDPNAYCYQLFNSRKPNLIVF